MGKFSKVLFGSAIGIGFTLIVLYFDGSRRIRDGRKSAEAEVRAYAQNWHKNHPEASQAEIEALSLDLYRTVLCRRNLADCDENGLAILAENEREVASE